jgi:hypothetical protein
MWAESHSKAVTVISHTQRKQLKEFFLLYVTELQLAIHTPPSQNITFCLFVHPTNGTITILSFSIQRQYTHF